jgi:beta-lactamase class D
VAAALESTGVVTGEYDIVQAYEAKRAEIAAWKNDDSPRVQAFAVWLIESLDQMIVSERQRAVTGISLRKHRYGAG